MTTVLVVDNYDSFAYNLVQYVGAAVGAPDAGEIVVRRNDAITVDGIRDLDPDGIVVSPGPGTPARAGVSVPVFRDLDYPTLGVCLGHQALCSANGGRVGHAPAVVHGKPSAVRHDGRGVFEGLPDTLEVGRYHSLAVERKDLPASLVETAYIDGSGGTGSPDGRGSGTNPDERDSRTNPDEQNPRTKPDGPDGRGTTDRRDEREPSAVDGERGIVMGVRHRDRPHVGVQFHPESILTGAGMAMVENFCRRCTGSDRERITG